MLHLSLETAYTARLKRIELRLSDTITPYAWGWDIRDEIVDGLRALGADRFLLITDDIVARLIGHEFAAELSAVAPVSVICVGYGELAKTWAMLGRVCDEAIAQDATRRSCVVALGGGVVGNLAGLVAGLLFRGIRLIHIPTTIVAAYDSVISLKQAVNSNFGKNHLGLFLSPTSVYVDLKLFTSLPEREFRSGMGELAKNALAILPEFSHQIARFSRPEIRRTRRALDEMLPLAIEAKQRVMRFDAKEGREALVLEYGHTIGHAIELVSMRRQLECAPSHGEAVGLGMLMAADIARRHFGASQQLVDLHQSMLDAAGLPSRVDPKLDPSEILDVVSKDNKRGYIPCTSNEIAMVLLKDAGVPIRTERMPLVPVPLRHIEDALHRHYAEWATTN